MTRYSSFWRLTLQKYAHKQHVKPLSMLSCEQLDMQSELNRWYSRKRVFCVEAYCQTVGTEKPPMNPDDVADVLQVKLAWQLDTFPGWTQVAVRQRPSCRTIHIEPNTKTTKSDLPRERKLIWHEISWKEQIKLRYTPWRACILASSSLFSTACLVWRKVSSVFSRPFSIVFLAFSFGSGSV
jgi:hypothetical protein